MRKLILILSQWLLLQKKVLKNRYTGIYRKPYEVKKDNFYDGVYNKLLNMNIIWEIFGFTLVFLVAVFFIFCCGKSLLSDGMVYYCYVEHTDGIVNDTWYLWGKRNWRVERNLGKYSTLDEALIAAKKMNCSIETK